MALVIDGNGDITGLVAGALPSTVIGAGAVLQVVQGLNNTYQSTNSSTPTTTNLSVTITPTSLSSKILVMIHGAGAGTNSASTGAEYSIYKNGSSLFVFDRLNGYSNAGSCYVPVTGCYLDSPATLSPLTYTLYYRTYYNSGSAFLNNYASTPSSQSTITAMEISG